MSLPYLTTRFVCSFVIGFGFIASIELAPSVFAADEKQPFGIEDYFKIKRVTELTLSSDGAMIAYVVESKPLEENKAVRTIYISATTPDAKPIFIEGIQNSRSLAWIPGTHELAFLLYVGGTTQVHSVDTRNNKIRQYTNDRDSVVKFLFSPNGAALAWLTQSAPERKQATLYEQLINGDEGVVIDSENTSFYQFIDPEWPDDVARPLNKLWLKGQDIAVFQIETPGLVKSFYWSSDASELSITYAGNDLPKEAFFDIYTSLGVFDIVAKKFWTLARARPPSAKKGAQYYTGGEWIPDTTRLFVRRMVEYARWAETTAWTTVDISDAENLDDIEIDWRDIDFYGGNPEPAFLPADKNTTYANLIIRARQFLYQIEPSGIKRADMLDFVQGSVSQVRFSADYNKAVFVNESLVVPPEIYVWEKEGGVEKISRINIEIAAKRMPKARELAWRSEDGVTVQGWLLEPASEDSENNPWPLITFVHGGPSSVVPDEFAFHFSFGGIWPYPFETYALNGMAVFIPNYRGTHTFGDKFANPTSGDGEPVDDIVSGIKHLIDEGIADPDRLAISGHSHGAWLGSLVMTRSQLFRAASFAEGMQNYILAYSLTPDYLNRDMHDILWGVSLYRDPQRYVDLSADLHFEGLEAAILFEAGVKSLAIGMMASPKAARRAGMPAEFVVYPKTGHNIQIPRLQKESAERNLDWFRFWLQGEEDPDPAKAEQYTRWRDMREQRWSHAASASVGHP